MPEDTTTTQKAIHELRVAIDRTIQHTRTLANVIARGTGGREVALSITHLQEAKMWLGQALGELGSKLPPEYRDEAQ